jgi:hypothetical protein
VRLWAKRFVLCAVFAVGTVGCEKNKPSDTVEGNGVAASAERDVAPFSRVAVGSRIELDVTVGNASKLELRGDRNLLPLVTSRSENGLLTLDVGKKIKPSMRLHARISVPRLDSASATKVARIDIQGLAADTFEANATDVAKLSAAGTAKALVLKGAVGASLDFSKVSAASATVRLEKAATARLGYLEELDVATKGATRVFYVGDPKIKKDVQKPARLIRTL